jgi:hypothetical protein
MHRDENYRDRTTCLLYGHTMVYFYVMAVAGKICCDLQTQPHETDSVAC